MDRQRKEQRLNKLERMQKKVQEAEINTPKDALENYKEAAMLAACGEIGSPSLTKIQQTIEEDYGDDVQRIAYSAVLKSKCEDLKKNVGKAVGGQLAGILIEVQKLSVLKRYEALSMPDEDFWLLDDLIMEVEEVIPDSEARQRMTEFVKSYQVPKDLLIEPFSKYLSL